MRVFLIRFFQQSQFKRSACQRTEDLVRRLAVAARRLARSVRSHATVWLDELERGVPGRLSDASAANGLA